MEKHDVVIIGGGIAGLTLAKFLAEYGMDFVLFEEHKDFFMKACGEGITRYILNYDFFELYDSKVGIEREINETEIYTKYGSMTLYMPVLMMDKKKVEREIANQAMRKGGNIVMGEKVEKIEYDGNFILSPQNVKAKLIVGADGFFSITRKFIGRKKMKYAIAVEGISDDIGKDKDKLHVEFKKSVVKYGYSWFFPKKKTWNIGVGSLKMEEFKKAFERFKKIYKVRKWKAGYVPVSKPIKPYGKNVMLIGDSASHTIASVGAGNMPSMICAKIAAGVIKKFDAKNYSDIDMREYERALRDMTKMLKYEHNMAYAMHYIIRNEYIVHKLMKRFVERASLYYKKLEGGKG